MLFRVSPALEALLRSLRAIFLPTLVKAAWTRTSQQFISFGGSRSGDVTIVTLVFKHQVVCRRAQKLGLKGNWSPGFQANHPRPAEKRSRVRHKSPRPWPQGNIFG